MEERAALLARVSADHGTEIKDPATGEVIGRVAFGTPGDVAAAVDTAAKAQPGWAALDDQERCAALMRVADAIDAHAEELAYVVSREQGKTMELADDHRLLADRSGAADGQHGGPEAE